MLNEHGLSLCFACRQPFAMRKVCIGKCNAYIICWWIFVSFDSLEMTGILMQVAMTYSKPSVWGPVNCTGEPCCQTDSACLPTITTCLTDVAEMTTCMLRTASCMRTRQSHKRVKLTYLPRLCIQHMSYGCGEDNHSLAKDSCPYKNQMFHNLQYSSELISLLCSEPVSKFLFFCIPSIVMTGGLSKDSSKHLPHKLANKYC